MALQSGFVLFLGSSKLCTAFPIVDLNTSWSVAFFSSSTATAMQW